METRKNISKKAGETLSIQQSDDTRKFYASLLLTCKNVFLYPEGHSISMNAIKQIHETLGAYIHRYGDIKIEFERDRVICQGAEVQSGRSEEGTLPFTLFRDGVRWLEFTEGIELEEFRKVLSIIHRYSVLTTEPEGDIVTAFWESHFNHVLYKADDLFSEQLSDQMDGLSTVSHATETETETEAEIETEDKTGSLESKTIDTESTGGIAIDPALFVLTPQEQTELEAMVAIEEKSSTTEHLNMLLDMLLQCREEKDFNLVLEVLSEEFDISFMRHDFEAALIILDGVRQILKSNRTRALWASPLIESFYKIISSDAKCLKPLEDIWSNLNARQIETLKSIFQHLSPGAVDALAHLLLIGQVSQLEQIAVDAIIVLAREDIKCLESLVNDPDERIAELLVPILSGLESDMSLKYLLKLARHSSASIRRAAIKTIATTRADQMSAIFEFIEDPDASVRNAILKYMGQSRNETAENLLLQYLENMNFKDAQDEHIIECFRALGKSGSVCAVPFLKKTLMRRKWIAGFSRSASREGAALALIALNIPEALRVIEEAGGSFYPGLRKIVRRAGKEFFSRDRGGR